MESNSRCLGYLKSRGVEGARQWWRTQPVRLVAFGLATRPTAGRTRHPRKQTLVKRRPQPVLDRQRRDEHPAILGVVLNALTYGGEVGAPGWPTAGTEIVSESRPSHRPPLISVDIPPHNS